MSAANVTSIAYLAAAVLFILGLKGLGRPRTAPRGNLLGASGMLVAVLATLLDRSIVDFRVLVAGLVVGSVVGAVLAVRVQMTGMPQLVALFNGFGGGASVLVAGASFLEVVDGGRVDDQLAVAAALTALIGIVTLTGSLVAFAKLQEVLSLRGFRGLGLFRAALGLVSVGAAVMVVAPPGGPRLVLAPRRCGRICSGCWARSPSVGADMPVVIALLNSCSGLAASAGGFVLDNPLLIIAGSLVGASGLILTQIMCTSMNRSLFDVVFGSMGSGGTVVDVDEVYGTGSRRPRPRR
ncbi:MAG: hypothetical protein Ct9H300mP31_21300 [Acidimicrobiaceae bacterium]|nr:MAG: hypothetical protein Ct9H300mP31_21300 [Acidimicrobiaceae bacterium]